MVAVDFNGAEKIVVRDDRRAGALRNRGQVIQRDHLAGVGADIEVMQILCRHAEGLIGLHEDAISTVVVVEVVDVLRTHKDAEGGGDLRERNIEGLGLFAVDGDQHLRVIGGEGCLQAAQFLAGAACAHNLVRHAVKISQRVRSCILQHELKSAESCPHR